MRRIISFCLVAILIILNINVYAEGKSTYVMVDFSENYNAKIFANGGEKIADFENPLNYIGAYKQVDGQWVPVTDRALNKSGFEAVKKEDGLIYSTNNIPFDVDTSGGVAFGGREDPLKSHNVALNLIYAQKLHILMPATKGVDSSKKYTITVNYKDGTKEENNFTFNGITYLEIEGGVAVGNSFIKNAEGALDTVVRYYDVVSIATNENKAIESLDFYTSDRYAGFAVIGITAEFDKNNTENYKSVFNANAIENAIEDADEMVPLEEILANSVVSSADFKMPLSSYTTGKYLFSPSKETKEDVDPYTSLIDNGEYMLNMDLLTEKLDGSYLKTKNAEYDFSHLDEKYRGVYVKKETTFYPSSNYYSSINFIAFNNNRTEVTDFPVKITYADGICETKTINLYQGTGAISADKASKMLLNAGKIHADILWASTGESTTGKNEVLDPVVYAPVTDNNGFGYILEYKIDVSADKRVNSITFGSADKNCYIFGLTLNKKEVTQETIEKEVQKLDISDNSIYEKIYYISGLINNKNLEVPQKYYDVVNALKETYNGQIFYEVSDLTQIKDIVNSNEGFLNGGADVIIKINDGEYLFDEALLLDYNCTPKGKGKVILTAEKGKVSFSGAMKIDKDLFTLVPGTNNKIYVAELENLPAIKDKTRYIGYVNLIKDGVAEPIASYPNKGYAHFEELTPNKDGFYFEGVKKEWANAQNAMVEGYLVNDYAYEITKGTIDAENKTITLGDVTLSTKYDNRRFKITNILEELDSEGEWYLDTKASKLYYMPESPADLDNLELAYLDDNLLKVKDYKNLVVENIIFKNSRGDAVRVADSDNITIKNCEFYNLSVWSAYVTDSKNVVFEENVIRDTASGITIKGGDYTNLTPSDNIIRNNLMYNIGWYTGYGRNIPVVLDDVGSKVMGNTIYNLPFHAINYHGNDNLIAYNEIYDVCNETNDVSAIYSNGKYYHRGSQVCYNYIHDIDHSYNFADYVPEKEWSFIGVQCVYLDNALNGQYVHHNIFKNVLCGVNVNCGQYNTVTENALIDIKNEGVNLTSYASGDKERVESFTEDFLAVENNEAYSKYEGLVNPTETEYAGRPAYNKVTDNILVNSEVVFTSENIKYFGVVENNTEASVDEYGFAVDCENPQILSQKNFDVNNFGIEENVNKNINVNVVQKNNSYTFDVEDSLKIGNYELYIENEKVAEFSDSVTLKTLPSYGDVSIKVVPVSKGLKVKSNAFVGKEKILQERIGEFVFLDEKGKETNAQNTRIIQGNINNIRGVATPFVAVYKNGKMVLFKKISGNDTIDVSGDEIKIMIWNMKTLVPYGDFIGKDGK